MMKRKRLIPTTPNDTPDHLLAGILVYACQQNKQVHLQMSHAGQEGSIVIRDGQIIHARVGQMTGEEAFYEMFLWFNYDILFCQALTTPRQTIDKGWLDLLMEAVRRSKLRSAWLEALSRVAQTRSGEWTGQRLNLA